jgi:hypothetical protein
VRLEKLPGAQLFRAKLNVLYYVIAQKFYGGSVENNEKISAPNNDDYSDAADQAADVVGKKIHNLALDEAERTAELVGKFYQTLIRHIPCNKPWSSGQFTPENALLQRLSELYMHSLLGNKLS